jgi:hypothetical protein
VPQKKKKEKEEEEEEKKKKKKRTLSSFVVHTLVSFPATAHRYFLRSYMFRLLVAAIIRKLQ